jgi:hypothetical protein
LRKKDRRNDEAPLVAGRGLLDASLLPWFDQRARVSGSPPGFLSVIVRLVIEIIMNPRYRTAGGL